MNTLRRSGRSALSRMMTALIVTVAGMTQVGMSAAEPQLYEGIASLCAIDPTTVETETRGNGVLVEKQAVQLYRVETEPAGNFVNGWEVLTSQLKTARNEKQFYMGTATLTPFGYEGMGTLKDNFNLLQDGSFPAGTWEGTGDLEGVVVEYQLVPYFVAGIDPAVLAQMCAESPPYCSEDGAVCVPMAGEWGWAISGVIYDNRDD